MGIYTSERPVNANNVHKAHLKIDFINGGFVKRIRLPCYIVWHWMNHKTFKKFGNKTNFFK